MHFQQQHLTKKNRKETKIEEIYFCHQIDFPTTTSSASEQRSLIIFSISISTTI